MNTNPDYYSAAMDHEIEQPRLATEQIDLQGDIRKIVQMAERLGMKHDPKHPKGPSRFAKHPFHARERIAQKKAKKKANTSKKLNRKK